MVKMLGAVHEVKTRSGQRGPKSSVPECWNPKSKKKWCSAIIILEGIEHTFCYNHTKHASFSAVGRVME